MKKTLIALAALAAAGVASAQSSVTLFGVVDATLAHGSGSVANKTQLTNSGYNSSRLGFRGTEDLGAGMSASFWLEAGLNNDNGSGAATGTNNQGATTGGGGLTFNRRSTVSLAGAFGELRLGRDYTPQFWNLTVYDPFGTNGVGTAQTLNSWVAPLFPTGVRASNSIGYFTPNLGGFTAQVQYYLGENASNAGATKDDGTGYGIRAGYAAGPLNLALAVSRTKYAAGDVKQNNLGAEYDLKVAKLQAHVSRDSISGVGDGNGYLVGALVPVGAGTIRAAYSRTTFEPAAGGAEPTSKKWAVGYVYDLSKRTAVYGTYARVTNSGGASAALNGATTAANGSSNGYDLGIRHSF